ncbi:hypothetical protein U1Q18_032279 [Sarracenia purpurea var. burkii]
MSTNMASPPPEILYSNTCSEIKSVEETNHSSFSNNNLIQKAATHNLINNENEKPASGVVADQPKAREDSTVTSLCFPFKSRQNLKPKPIAASAAAVGVAANYTGALGLNKNGEAKPNDNVGTSTGPRSDDSNGNKESKERLRRFQD